MRACNAKSSPRRTGLGKSAWEAAHAPGRAGCARLEVRGRILRERGGTTGGGDGRRECGGGVSPRVGRRVKAGDRGNE